MTEESYRRYDVLFKALSVPITVVGVLIGIWQFLEAQQSSRKLELEKLERTEIAARHRALWEKQRDVYASLSTAVGRVAAAANEPKRLKEATVAFDEHYWGDVILVEDTTVRSRMRALHEELHDFEQAASNADRVKIRVNEVVEACRMSLEGSRPGLPSGSRSVR